MENSKVYFTKNGMDLLDKSFSDHDEKVRRLYKDLGEACRDDPDLPENLISKEIRTKFQTEIPNERTRLLGMKAAAIVVETSLEFINNPDDVVWIGSEVTYRELDSNDEYTLKILGMLEDDYENNVISYEAPIAKAMKGKKAGDVFTMDGRKGKYLILNVRRVLKAGE